MNHNWSASKQRLHPQSVAEISRHSVLSGDRIRQCETSSGSRHKDTGVWRQKWSPVFAYLQFDDATTPNNKLGMLKIFTDLLSWRHNYVLACNECVMCDRLICSIHLSRCSNNGCVISTAIGRWRKLNFSLPRPFAPGSKSSRCGTFAPWNFRSLELSLPCTFQVNGGWSESMQPGARVPAMELSLPLANRARNGSVVNCN